MTFDEVISALAALEGEQVTAQVVGDRADAAPLVIMDGVLRMMHTDDSPTERSEGEAITFVVGQNGATLALWPNHFVDAVNDELNGMKIITREGVLRVYRNRPWLD